MILWVEVPFERNDVFSIGIRSLFPIHSNDFHFPLRCIFYNSIRCSRTTTSYLLGVCALRISIRQSEKYRKSFVFRANDLWEGNKGAGRGDEGISHYGCRILIRFVWFLLPPSRSTQFINENVFASMHFTSVTWHATESTSALPSIRSATKCTAAKRNVAFHCWNSGKATREKNWIRKVFSLWSRVATLKKYSQSIFTHDERARPLHAATQSIRNVKKWDPRHFMQHHADR